MKQLLFLLFFITSFCYSQGPIDGFFKGKKNLDLAASGFYQDSKKYYSGIGLINYS